MSRKEKPSYNHWTKMNSKCRKYNKEHPTKPIKIYEEWKDFEKFNIWFENNTKNGETFFIRLNDTKDFTPENCKMMLETDARKFKSKNVVKIEYNGKNLSLTDWEQETGISRHILSYRLNAGWSVEDIFNTPSISDSYDKNKNNHKRLYDIWISMKQRCQNKNNPKYKNYGAKGICVCEEWKNNFQAFKQWAKENGYEKDLTIERKNINKDYCPENCTWISLKEQSKNRSNNHQITYNGKTMILQDWANEVGISSATIRKRLKSGWTIEDALFTPIGMKKQNLSKKEKIKRTPEETKIYTIWTKMHTMCKKYNKEQQNNTIKVCKEWENFNIFYKYCMQFLSKDKNLFFIRYDDSKDFTPENCTFMNEKNARSFKSSNGENYFLTYNNKTMTILDWSKEVGISLRIMRRRLKAGWTVEDTLCTPIGKRRK